MLIRVEFLLKNNTECWLLHECGKILLMKYTLQMFWKPPLQKCLLLQNYVMKTCMNIVLEKVRENFLHINFSIAIIVWQKWPQKAFISNSLLKIKFYVSCLKLYILKEDNSKLKIQQSKFSVPFYFTFISFLFSIIFFKI